MQICFHAANDFSGWPELTEKSVLVKKVVYSFLNFMASVILFKDSFRIHILGPWLVQQCNDGNVMRCLVTSKS